MRNVEIVNKNGKVELKVELTYKDGNKIVIQYSGEGELNAEETKKRKHLVLNILGSYNTTPTAETIIYNIRTIFRDQKELNLSINTWGTEYGFDIVNTQVEFKKRKLVTYLRSGKHRELGKLYFNYSSGKGIAYGINDKDFLELDYDEYEEFESFLNSEKDAARSLSEKTKEFFEAKKIEIRREEKALCEAYRLFYLESPDFSNYTTKIKTQAMVMLMNECSGMNIGNLEYGFTNYGSLIPKNEEFSRMINRLAPYGKIESSSATYNYTESARRRLLSVGRIVRETFRESTLDEVENYKNLIFTIKSEDVLDFDKIGNPDAIANRYGMEPEEAVRCLKLVSDASNR